MHAKPDLRVEFEPNGHFFRLGDLCRYPLGSFFNMGNPNTHESLSTIVDDPLLASEGPGKTWSFAGFLLGALMPVALGIYSLQSEAAYRASLPEEDRILCGMGTLTVLTMMGIGIPLLGVVGGLIGYCLPRLPRQP